MRRTRLAGQHPTQIDLGAYHDGELRGFARAEVEEHLAECPRCRRERQVFAALDGALRGLPAVVPGMGVDAMRLARMAGGGRTRRLSLRPVWLAVAPLAVLAAVLVGHTLAGVAPLAALPPAASLPMGTSTQGQTDNAHRPAGALSLVTNDRLAPVQAAAPLSPRSAAGVSASGFAPAQAAHGQSSSVSVGTDSASTLGRLIARTGEMDLQAPDVQRSFAMASAIAVAQGGYVAESNNAATAGDGSPAATLTMRVPAGNFVATLDALARLPHRQMRRSTSTQDITDSYHDLQASLQALQATRAQLISLMRKARTTDDAMTVLDRLTGVNTQLDSVQSQITASAQSVMLSTIAVVLTPEPRHVLPVRAHTGPGWQPGRDLGYALANVGLMLQHLISAAIYAIIYLALPALLLAMVLLMRRLRHRTT